MGIVLVIVVALLAWLVLSVLLGFLLAPVISSRAHPRGGSIVRRVSAYTSPATATRAATSTGCSTDGASLAAQALQPSPHEQNRTTAHTVFTGGRWPVSVTGGSLGAPPQAAG